MTITRIFLGLQQPALPAAAEYLVARFGAPALFDLREVIVVVPGARAGRRLLEVLVDLAAEQGRPLVPPQIHTVGQLPELLYQAKKPFADDLVQQLAWVDALRKHEPAQLSALVAERPDNDDTERWLNLGRLLQSLHRELASDGLDFSDVVTQGQRLPGFGEAERWQALAAVQRQYLETLDHLELWDRQTARLFAIEHRECRMERPVVVVAAVDLNRSLRQMLDQVADQVTALIYAPEEWADRFDVYGCLLPEVWREVELDIPDSCLRQGSDAADQCELVVRRIAQFAGRYPAEDITIGLPDERMVAPLVRQLDACRLPNRYGPGQPVSRTGVYRLLADLAAYTRGNRYDDFAALVRHPDMEAWLLGSGVGPGWIEELDGYYNEHLPVRIDGEWVGQPDEYPRLRQAHRAIELLTRSLRGTPQLPVQWLPEIDRIIFEVYGQRNFDLEDEADHRAWKACHVVQEALSELARVPGALMPAISGADVLRWLLDRIHAQWIASTAVDAATELVGWLELPLDDAPALIVTSFNEGLVPSSANADMFLPGNLRSALGLDDNARRYARDAYAVAALLAPWRETTFIVAQRGLDDDPLAPSRLLFAAAPEIVTRRALRFFDEAAPRPAEQPLLGALAGSRTESDFVIPCPRPLRAPITRMSVTSFRAYLACPYRYYLSHVLKLTRIDDAARELDGAAFGDLAHTVLELFGRSDVRDSADADTIEKELRQLLNELVQQRFGEHPSAALLVQIAQLRLRLCAFAGWQASWVSRGWRIEHVEPSFHERPGQLLVDGEPMLLTGRIDRIDVHEQTGQRIILDYKTSDAGESPHKTHRKGGREWIDLQLPLYRHLARQLGIEEPVGLGYVLLPKIVTETKLSEAEWTAADLEEADEVARNVVRGIRREQFWPPKEPPPRYSEEFADLCLDGVFGRKIVS
jgi:hypothetical protein